MNNISLFRYHKKDDYNIDDCKKNDCEIINTDNDSNDNISKKQVKYIEKIMKKYGFDFELTIEDNIMMKNRLINKSNKYCNYGTITDIKK